MVSPVYITVLRNTIDIDWNDADAQSGEITISVGNTITKTASITSNVRVDPYPAHYDPQNSNIIYRLNPSTSDVASVDNSAVIVGKKAGVVKIEAVYPEDVTPTRRLHPLS